MNPQNFPDRITNLQDQRPSRIAQRDAQLIQSFNEDGTFAEKEIVFGQTLRDNVEVYVYDELNSIVGHTIVRPDNPNIRLLTFAPDQTQIGVGQDSTPDNLQLDLVAVLNSMNDGAGLPPGRYSISLNFFRDEVGSEQDGKLYIAEISPSRMELRLGMAVSTVNLLNGVREFATPSAPRVDMQALVDQTFGTALTIQQGEAITLSHIEGALDATDTETNTTGSLLTTSRLGRAGVNDAFALFVLQALPNIRNLVVDELAARVGDLEIQQDELQRIIASSTKAVLQQMVQAGMLHPKIQLVDTNNIL